MIIAFAPISPERQLLIDAERALDEHGWTKNTSLNSQGQMCMSGALNYATFGTAAPGRCVAARSEKGNLLKRVRRILADVVGGSITGFNDRRTTTFADIKAALHKAQEKA